MQDVTISGVVWGARSLPPHKTGTVEAVLPCSCRPVRAVEEASDDLTARTFKITFHVIGEPPYTLKGVPCGCGSGRSYTVQLDVKPTPAGVLPW